MKGAALRRAIDAVARTGDLASLADYLADDVELSVAIAVDLPPSLKRSGKRFVVEHLRSMGPEAKPAAGPCELFAQGARIVALCDEQLAIGRGLAVRSARAMVFDVEDESIARVHVHFELHPNVKSPVQPATKRTS